MYYFICEVFFFFFFGNNNLNLLHQFKIVARITMLHLTNNNTNGGLCFTPYENYIILSHRCQILSYIKNRLHQIC